MSSVEELEDAIDAMEGFSDDGGALDTSDVREARVRSAYMDWCKEYGRPIDEARFPTFSSNFLAMEEYSRENGREMVLNKYADCTEEEYRKLTEGECGVFSFRKGGGASFPLFVPCCAAPAVPSRTMIRVGYGMCRVVLMRDLSDSFPPFVTTQPRRP